MNYKKNIIYSLMLISALSCVSVNKYEDLLTENKQLQRNQINYKSILNEIETLKFKIKNLEFNLNYCEIKLKKQDRKLIECIENSKGNCND